MIELTSEQRRALRAAAHHLNPVVSIAGKGLSAAVLKEIDRSLKAHELIKVKLYDIEREDRDAVLAEICAQMDCAPVQHIGNILVLWREKPDEPQKSATASRRGKPMTKKQAAAAQENAPRRRAPARPTRT
ncbi:MAG TPA: ribosome assembly RNA-binding protein YhbY [Rhodocyclaceae bacterium]|nr:ribosome assembly RNA-binding protein YhbY [Rhodocyclaceae bacterium]